MRLLLILWAVPVSLITLWYTLSANDISFGTLILSREMHDLVFQIYGKMLGVDPAVLPGMLLRTLVFDTFLVALIIAYRKRKVLIPVIKRGYSRLMGRETDTAHQVRPAE